MIEVGIGRPRPPASITRSNFSRVDGVLQGYAKELRLAMVQNWADMYDNLTNWTGMDSGLRAASQCRIAMTLYGELQQHYLSTGFHLARGWHLYKLYPKNHQVIHVVEDGMAKYGNPIWFWCYPDESEIGAAAKIAESVHVSNVHKSVIRKHRLLPA